jgi:hypothetical protein
MSVYTNHCLICRTCHWIVMERIHTWMKENHFQIGKLLNRDLVSAKLRIEDDERDQQRIHLVECLCNEFQVYVWVLFFSVAPFPLDLKYARGWSFFHCDQQRGLERSGRTGTWRSSWSNDIFWRVMRLSRNPTMVITPLIIYLALVTLLFFRFLLTIGWVISLVAVNLVGVSPRLDWLLCSIRLCNLILHDLGVIQSTTARSKSFLRQSNNNPTCYYRGWESNRAPRVGGPKIY